MTPPQDAVELRFEARDLTKTYAVTVLRQVDFSLRAGEIHALLGANGAGKSTLCRIIAGLTAPSQGTMHLDGAPYAPADKGAAERAGVQIVQQELNFISTLSVAENLFLNRLPRRWGVIDQRALHQRSRQALDRLGLTDVAPGDPMHALGVGRQQLVEIASALDRQCRLLILDEPTAALSAAETARLFQQLSRLRQAGVGIIYISHRLDEVQQLADRATILRDGKRIETQPIARLSTRHIVMMMTGENRLQEPRADRPDPPRHQADASVVLRVHHLSRPPWVHPTSFSVRCGERLGVYGLVGSGRTELLRLIFGADVARSGEVILGEHRVFRRFAQPRQAVARGIAMITEDRKQNGLLLSQAVRVNIMLCSMDQCVSRWGLIHASSESRLAAEHANQLGVQCQSLEQPVGELSGGNQQKVAIAKWLARDAQLFLFDEPTRGIDVAARRRIYELLDALAAKQRAMVIVSSDLDELLEVCDTLAVMSLGRLAASRPVGAWTRQEIMAAAFAGHGSGEGALA